MLRLRNELAPLAAVVVALVGSPGIAAACAVCGGGTADNRFEFILTTAVLTFLPLGMMFGVFWYFRRRYLALANQAPPRDGQDIPRISKADAGSTTQSAPSA